MALAAGAAEAMARAAGAAEAMALAGGAEAMALAGGHQALSGCNLGMGLFRLPQHALKTLHPSESPFQLDLS